MKDKVYHIHLRKTGGTSVNYSFMSLSGIDPAIVYKACTRAHGATLDFNGLAFCSETRDLSQPFFYGHGHRTWLELENGSDEVFMFTIIRDPIERFISYWRMISWQVKRAREGKEMNTFLIFFFKAYDPDISVFAKSVETRHLMPCLFTFSGGNFDLISGVKNIQNLDLVLETEFLEDSVAVMSRALHLPLALGPRMKKSKVQSEVTDQEKAKLADLLAPEIEFVTQIKTLDNFWTAHAVNAS